MYAVVVKNDNVYDVIGFFSHQKNEVMETLDSAWETGLPITAIDASSYKQTALYGATWNGSSFSGGTAGPNLASATQEQLDSFDLYAFLSNNTVVARIAIATNSPKKEMYAAAVATGMSLLKVPSSQNLLLGFSYNWDGTSFSEIA